jgi:ubiquinone/menaquinone biosynthesis C-methylase UbiE
VATGLGEPALTAARRVSPGGRVVATDIAPGMIALARERAAEAGVDNVEFVEVDAEALDLAEGEFDAVLSRWGLMFFPDLPGAVARMRRVLVPGGRLAATVWTEPERSPMVALAMRVAAQRLELPPPGPGVPGPFALADLPALEAVISAAGFEDVRSERVAIQAEYESAEEYGAFMRDIAAPIHGMLASRPPEEAESLWDAIVDAARPFEQDGGRIVLPGETVCVVARKP